jgi:deoxyadenosine/deoxycytidine kinase
MRPSTSLLSSMAATEVCENTPARRALCMEEEDAEEETAIKKSGGLAVQNERASSPTGTTSDAVPGIVHKLTASQLVCDADYIELNKWNAFEPDKDESSGGVVNVIPGKTHSGSPISNAELQKLRGVTIVIEGGIGQGKTQLSRRMATIIEQANIKCSFSQEPIDAHVLSLFMKFHKLPDESTTDNAAIDLLKEARRRAAMMMQFTVMRKRAAMAKTAAKTTDAGGVAILDRGFFGDVAFMVDTFTSFDVPFTAMMQYIIDFQRLYIDAGFGGKRLVIVRFTAPVSVTHQRWCTRESSVGGNKYSTEYMQSIESAHDVCARAWGKHITYDNSNIDIPGSKSYIDAVNALIRAICDFAV